MPLPEVRIWGQFYNEGEPAQGSVTFSDELFAVDSTSGQVITPVRVTEYLDQTGTFVAKLPLNSAPDSTPQARSYHVELSVAGNHQAFDIVLPSDAWSINIADLMPLGIPPELTPQYVASIAGLTGNITSEELAAAVGELSPVAGDSAYEVWLSQGHSGTEAEFLTSLRGPKGDPGASVAGPTGLPGPEGVRGPAGPVGAPFQVSDTVQSEDLLPDGQVRYTIIAVLDTNELWLSMGNDFWVNMGSYQGPQGEPGDITGGTVEASTLIPNPQPVDRTGGWSQGSIIAAPWNPARKALSGIESFTGSPFQPAVMVNDAYNPGLNQGQLYGWYSNNGATYPVTVDTAIPISGVASAMTTRTSSTPSTAVSSIYHTGNISAVFHPCLPNTSYTAAMDVRTEYDPRDVTIYIIWRDGAGGALSNSAQVVTQAGAAGITQRYKVTATSPATAGQFGVICTVNVRSGSGNAIVGERVWYDNVYLGSDSAGVYADGDLPGNYWAGGHSRTPSYAYAQPMLAARNEMPAPCETAAPGLIGVRYSPYVTVNNSGTAKTAANYNLAPNPSFSGGSTNWAHNDPTHYAPPGHPISGGVDDGAYVQIRKATGGAPGAPYLYSSNLTIAKANQAAVSGDWFSFSFAARPFGASVIGVKAVIYAVDANFAIVPSATNVIANFTFSGTDWQRFTATGTISTTYNSPLNNPIEYVAVYLYTKDGNVWADGEGVDIDQLMLLRNYPGRITPSYFDGAMPGNSWEGSTTGSRSVQPVTFDGRPVTRMQATGTAWTQKGNLITAGVNGTFEGNITGVLGSGAAPISTVAYDTTRSHSGTGCLKVTYNGTQPSGGQAAYVLQSGLVAGQAYTYEGWLYVPADSVSAAPSLRMSGPTVVTPPVNVTTPDTWVFCTQSFIAIAGNNYLYMPLTGAASTAGQTCYVDDLKLYQAQNLLVQGVNGTFEGSIVGWAAGGTVPTIAADATRAHSGSGSMKITWPAGAATSGSVATVTMSGLTVGRQYTAEAWIYVPTGGADASVLVSSIGGGNIVATRDQWVLSSLSFLATVANHSIQVANRSIPTAGQTCYVDDVRLYESTNTFSLGIRNFNTSANNPAIPQNTAFVFSLWALASPDAITTSINALFRDDPNSDSAAAVFDPATPANLPVTTVQGNWIRYSWRATVKAARTITGIYFYFSSNTVQPRESFLDTTEWMVSYSTIAEAYFDGDSPNGSWNGTAKTSTSTRTGSRVVWSSTVASPTSSGHPIHVRLKVYDDNPNAEIALVVRQKISGEWLYTGPWVTGWGDSPGWKELTADFVMPSSCPADSVQVGAVRKGSTPNAEQLVVGDAFFEVGTDTDYYFDGDTYDSPDMYYNWSGAPNQSYSYRGLPSTKQILQLDQVDNTRDLDKPVSKATQTAIDIVATTVGKVKSVNAMVGDVLIGKNQVGLDQVANLAPADLPISTATQTALNTDAAALTAAQAQFTTDLGTKEPKLAPSDATQWYRGDKTWRLLPPPQVSGIWGTAPLVGLDSVGLGQKIYLDANSQLSAQPLVIPSGSTLAASAIPSAYPQGTSVMTLFSADATAGGWPAGDATVVTHHRYASQVNRTAEQYWHSNVAAPAQSRTLIRHGTSAGWSGWRDVLYNGESIGDGANLNNYNLPGLYVQSNSNSASTGTNYPVPYAGSLEVRTQEISVGMVWQRYTVYAGSTYANMTWQRGSYQGVWGAWETVQTFPSVGIQAGSVGVTIGAINTVCTAPVVFPIPYPTGTKLSIFTQIATSGVAAGTEDMFSWTSGASVTGFTASVKRSVVRTTTVQWQVVPY